MKLTDTHPQPNLSTGKRSMQKAKVLRFVHSGPKDVIVLASESDLVCTQGFYTFNGDHKQKTFSSF